MVVQVIANAYSSDHNKNLATPVTAEFGPLVLGGGNIRATIGSNQITTFDHNFKSLLGNLYVIRDNNSNYVGKIKYIIDDSNAVLCAPASVSISSNAAPVNWKFQTYTQSVINYDPSIYRFTDDPHKGNGTITISNANSYVIGVDTIFLKQLAIGNQIFTILNDRNELVGTVKNVLSNTSALLNTVSPFNLSNISYRFYDSISQNTSNVFSPKNDILNSRMLEWSKSGLIPGVIQVKSYHPPVQDPVTGSLVNFPATTHTSGSYKDIMNTSLTPIDSLPHTSHINSTGSVTDFDEDNGIIGSSIHKAINAIPINKIINSLTKTSNISDEDYNKLIIKSVNHIYGNLSIQPPPGIVLDTPPPNFIEELPLTSNQFSNYSPYKKYKGPGGNIVYVKNSEVSSLILPTVADIIAHTNNFSPPPRIIDNIPDANNYYSMSGPIESLTEAQKSDLAARATKQFNAGPNKKVTTSGVPAVIPGLLNIVLADENPANRQYNTPVYDEEFITVNTKQWIQYNPDLPISSINEPPAPL